MIGYIELNRSFLAIPSAGGRHGKNNRLEIYISEKYIRKLNWFRTDYTIKWYIIKPVIPCKKIPLAYKFVFV